MPRYHLNLNRRLQAILSKYKDFLIFTILPLITVIIYSTFVSPFNAHILRLPDHTNCTNFVLRSEVHIVRVVQIYCAVHKNYGHVAVHNKMMTAELYKNCTIGVIG